MANTPGKTGEPIRVRVKGTDQIVSITDYSYNPAWHELLEAEPAKPVEAPKIPESPRRRPPPEPEEQPKVRGPSPDEMLTMSVKDLQALPEYKKVVDSGKQPRNKDELIKALVSARE